MSVSSAEAGAKSSEPTSKSIARKAPRPVSFISRQASRVRSSASLAFQTACGFFEALLEDGAPALDPAVALPPDDWRMSIGGPAPPCLTLRLCLSSWRTISLISCGLEKRHGVGCGQKEDDLVSDLTRSTGVLSVRREIHRLDEILDRVQILPARQLDRLATPDDTRRLKEVPRVLCGRRGPISEWGQASAQPASADAALTDLV